MDTTTDLLVAAGTGLGVPVAVHDSDTAAGSSVPAPADATVPPDSAQGIRGSLGDKGGFLDPAGSGMDVLRAPAADAAASLAGVAGEFAGELSSQILADAEREVELIRELDRQEEERRIRSRSAAGDSDVVQPKLGRCFW